MKQIQFLLVIVLFLLTSCTAIHSIREQSTTPKPIANETVRESLGAELALSQVQVTQVGHNVSIILITDTLFARHTARFKRRSPRILDKVLAVLSTYHIEDIHFVGYTNELCTVQQNQGLAEQRVRAVTNYLWTHGLDARMMSMTVNASSEETNTYTKPYTRRIEINLQAIAVYT